jgi:hypothetical protein
VKNDNLSVERSYYGFKILEVLAVRIAPEVTLFFMGFTVIDTGNNALRMHDSTKLYAIMC